MIVYFEQKNKRNYADEYDGVWFDQAYFGQDQAADRSLTNVRCSRSLDCSSGHIFHFEGRLA